LVSFLLPPSSFFPSSSLFFVTMSRCFLVCLLLCVLSVCCLSSPFRPTIPPSDILSPSACANSCNAPHGTCVGSGTISTCICEPPYLSTDCSIVSRMRPLCWLNDTYCSYWSIQNGNLYQRVFAETNSTHGWAGIMWGANDGMTGGQSTILSVPTQYQAYAEEKYSFKKGMPAPLPDQSIANSSVTGMYYERGLDVSFVRALNPMLLNHTVLPSTSGSITNVSVAYSSTYFMFHMKNAMFLHLDLVGLQEGEGEGEEEAKATTTEHRHFRGTHS